MIPVIPPDIFISDDELPLNVLEFLKEILFDDKPEVAPPCKTQNETKHL